MGYLVLSRDEGESLVLQWRVTLSTGEVVTLGECLLTVRHADDGVARLAFEAPLEIAIWRAELEEFRGAARRGRDAQR